LIKLSNYFSLPAEYSQDFLLDFQRIPKYLRYYLW
jgi:hypothetical protein